MILLCHYVTQIKTFHGYGSFLVKPLRPIRLNESPERLPCVILLQIYEAWFSEVQYSFPFILSLKHFRSGNQDNLEKL